MYRPSLPPFRPAATHLENQNLGAFAAQDIHPAALFIPNHEGPPHVPQLNDMPQGWIDYINPSGATYYLNPQARLLTRLDPRVPGVAQRLVSHASHLSQLLQDWATALNARIFILSIQDDVVEYYMLDHRTHRLFWVHHTNSDALQLPQCYNEECFQSILRAYYWAHVEQCSEATPVDIPAEQELVATLLSGQTPGSHHLTPFSNEKSRQLIVALQSLTTTGTGGYRMASVGRLWRIISEHQHLDKYGPRAHWARIRLRDPVTFVRMRHRDVLGWLDWLQRLVPQTLAALEISETCVYCYTGLLIGVSEHLSRERPLKSRPLSMGLVAVLISLPLSFFFPVVDAYLGALTLEVGLGARWHRRSLAGLFAYDFGLYVGLLDVVRRAIDSPGSFPSTLGLLAALSALALPLGILVFQFAGQRVDRN